MNLVEIGKTISSATEAKIKAAIAALESLLANGEKEATEALRILQEAEMSHDEMRQALRDALKAKNPTAKRFYYIRDVYDSYFIYDDEPQYPDPSPAKLYKASYAIVDGVVTLGEPVEVRVERTYVPVTQQESADVSLVGDLVPLVEKAIRKDGTVPIKIIQPGWGSSGYYPAETLKRDGPKVFTKGLHMFVDHPTAQEDAERPERSVQGLGAVLETNAYWQDQGPAGPGLYADAKPFSPFKERLEDLAPHIGVSIRAMGTAKAGEAEGKKGPIIETIAAAKSVDFVTTPGAGGQVLQLFEAARGGRPTINLEVAQVNEQEAQVLREANATLEADNAQLKAEMARLREAALLREARDFVAETLKPIEMPELTRTRLVESLAQNPIVKDGALDRDAYKARIEETAKAEITYLAEATGSGQIRGMGASTPSGDDKPRLIESFRRLGMSEEQAKIAAEGR